MTEPLFTSDADDSDPAYVNIRAGESEPAIAARGLTEGLWQTYRPYADRHFRTKIQSAFDERFWEMYLTCALLDLGLPVSCPKSGPDILLALEETTIWLEAICPTQGSNENPDRVPDYNVDSPVATLVPNDEIIMRLRHAIETKVRVFDKYAAQGIVSNDSARIVAVNACQIPLAGLDREVPLIIRSVLPIGDMQVTFPRDPSVPAETGYQYCRAVERKKGAKIETDVFFQDRYRSLSAVLYSHVDAGKPTRRLGDDFILIHNPRALVPVPDRTICRGREYWVRESGDVFSLDSTVHE